MHRTLWRSFGMLALALSAIASGHAEDNQAANSDADQPSELHTSQGIDLTSVGLASTEEPIGIAGCLPCVPIPSMLGDGFFNRTGPVHGGVSIDRVVIVANDLDVPNSPAGNSPLTLSESGPVGIFEATIISTQQLQQLLRAGQPLPATSIVGTLTEDATVTTRDTVSEIQTQLADTPEAYDIIAVVPAPGAYHAGADAALQSRNGTVGTTAYNDPASGAMLQNGADALTGDEDIDAFYYYDYLVHVAVPSPHAAAVRSGTLKIANGGTPLPTDRVFFNYGLFTDVGFHSHNADIDRFTPGFEKTFYCGMLSLEMRFPFVAATDSDLVAGSSGVGNSYGTQFGDITAFGKVLLYASDLWTLSGGLALTIPTAPDFNISLEDGTPLVEVKNEAVHVGPFLGLLYTPSDRWFGQGFVQFDFATDGNEVSVQNAGNGLGSIGKLNDSSYVFLDAGVGYWINDPVCSMIPVAIQTELHYNASMSNADAVEAGPFRIGDPTADVDVLNLTVGGTAQLTPNTLLSAGYVTALTGNDRQFDGGLRLLLEYRP